MKKFFVVLLALTVGVTLAACGRNGDSDRTSPVFDGVDDVEIFLNEDFDPLDGVTATDHDGNDISDEITVTGSVDTSKTGTTFLRYRAEDSRGYYTEVSRYVTVVVNPDDLGDEIVPNGDFSLDMSFWTTTTGLEGGEGNFNVVDGELQIEVLSTSGGMWEPRLENKNVTLENGKIYQLSFDARALEPRAIHVQVGELLDAAPWFVDFKPGVPGVIDLTTDMETYTLTFVMDHDTNTNAAVIFEFGTVAGTIGTDNLRTTVYLDNVMLEEVDDYVDTIPPVIAGAGNRNVPLGSDFDPLEGVSVVDNIDGEIELTLDHVTGTVNTDELGEYTLVYTVSDEAGNETVVERIITVVEPDATPPGADYGWRTFLNDWEGTEGGLSVVDGQLVLNLDAINTWENWQIQIIQDNFAMDGDIDNEGSMQFEAGKTYRVSFDAKASVEGEAVLAIGAGIDWLEYYAEAFDVTNEMQTFTFEFTLDNDEIDYSTLAQFKIEMGMLFSGEEGPQSFTLDNVLIEVEADGDFVDAELIVNGDFEAMPEVFYDYGWRPFLNDWEGTAGHFRVVDGQLVLNLDAINTWENWQIQIIQDNFAMSGTTDNEGSMQFEAGKTYRVSFDAKASVEGEAVLAIGAGLGWVEYYAEAFNVTNEMQTFTFDFTLDNDEIDYSALAQFKLEMGMLFSGEEGPQSFTLDNVIIEVEEDGDFVDAELIVNGDFETMSEIVYDYGWRPFLNTWEGSDGHFRVVDGQLVLNLDAINTWENWQIQIIQDNFAMDGETDNEGSMDFTKGETYRVSFDAKASVAGEVTLAIGEGPDWVEYFVEAFDVTETMETYTFEFTLDGEADYDGLAQFKLEMGMLFSGLEAPQSFTLDNVLIEVEVEGDFVDSGLVVNGDFSGVEVVITP